MEKINIKQAIGMITLYVLGSAIVLASGAGAKQNIWIAMSLGFLLSVPFMLCYSYIITHNQEKDFIKQLEKLFGKTVSKIILVLFLWYSLDLGALVFRNFSEFIQVVSFPETPQYYTILPMGFICIWAVRSGIQVIGRWSVFTAPLLISIILLLLFLSIPSMQPDNMLPVLYEGWKPVIDNGLNVFSFPFAETVLFLFILPCLDKQKKSAAAYITGASIAFVLMALASVRNIMVIGRQTVQMIYFPSYAAVGIIDVANIIQRIEVLISTTLMFGGFLKISLCLYVSCKCLAGLINENDYKIFASPVCIIMMSMSMILYDNTMEMFSWAEEIYKYYAFPFQVILPLIIFAACIIHKNKSSKGKARSSNQNTRVNNP